MTDFSQLHDALKQLSGDIRLLSEAEEKMYLDKKSKK